MNGGDCTDCRPFPHTKPTNQHLSGWGGGVRVARETVYPSTSVVHEPSGLESLGIHLLAARTGVDEPTRAPWRLEPARTGVHEPTRL